MILAKILYGSHLYGTNTPTSDFDYKVVFLPDLKSLVLGKKLSIIRNRFDEAGNRLDDDCQMPASGYEEECIPIQKFVPDFLSGQSYAIEMVYAVANNAHQGTVTQEFQGLCINLVKKFAHSSVDGMVGFAVKQTFDYVRRGERLNKANEVLSILEDILAKFKDPIKRPRLDSVIPGTDTLVFDEILNYANLKEGVTYNHNIAFRTLKLNGREYMITTTIENMIEAANRLAGQYGGRSTVAAEKEVDPKSLMHAVRVYQQVIELLTTGNITFPRPNHAELLAVKNQMFTSEQCKQLLMDLDDRVEELTSSKSEHLITMTEAIKAEAMDYFYESFLLPLIKEI
jgi:predicted nucleotidyltransferase